VATGVATEAIHRSDAEILLVEDNHVNQKLALAVLGKKGYRITLVQNGQEAVDVLDSQTFAVVLMDMQMPVMDGVDATRAIRAREVREQRPRVPIIAMTANAMDGDRERCLDAGMDDYISKPINMNQLYEKLALWERKAASVNGDTLP
jgi:CheY-like chemotaxis protein